MKFRISIAETGNPAHEDIHSYSAVRVFSSRKGLNPAELRSLAGDAVRLVARGCDAAGAKDVSHVKAYLEHSSGFLHADTVGGNGEITIAGRDGTEVNRFRLVMNAVIYGLSEESITGNVEQALESVQARYGVIREPGSDHPGSGGKHG